MGRAKRGRRGVRRILRAVLRGLLAVGILSAVLAAVAGGNPLWALLVLPLSMLALLVIVPILLFVLIVVALSLALPVATLAAIVGGPAYVVYRLSGRGGRRARADRDDEDEAPVLAEDTVLRRRYVAGQLTYDQFQAGMVAFLRDRFARGELRLAEYEAELEKLLAPARHLDVKRDPTLAAAPAAANVP